VPDAPSNAVALSSINVFRDPARSQPSPTSKDSTFAPNELAAAVSAPSRTSRDKTSKRAFIRGDHGPPRGHVENTTI